MWEFTDKDLGFSFSGPGVIRKKDKVYVLFASGPTNYQGDADQNLKLFVVDLDNGRLVKTFEKFSGGFGIGAGESIRNAFGGRLFTQGLDENEDGMTDYIALGYSTKNGVDWNGGLLFGDVRRENPENWNFKKFFSSDRPIVAKVEFMKCFENWYMYFGTGRWFYKTDEKRIAQANYIYGVHLECDYPGCKPNTNFAHSSTDQCSSKSNVYSWKKELERMPDGYYPERMITDPSTTNSNVAVFVTMEPTGDICGFGGRTRVWALNCATGGALAEDCAQYPISSAKGKILLQLSGGDIRELTLEDFKNSSSLVESSNWMQGTPPPASSPVIPPAKEEKAQGEILLWLEK
jgi:type IV pilus assembly protein PilY1